jgi:geranylgeranyl reductase family protein
MKGYDLVVAGAGPAGSTAARVAANGGLRTLLLERFEQGRAKPCAGGLSIGAIRELGFALPEAIVERRCRGMRVAQGEYSRLVRAEDFVAAMVTRSDFDSYLAAKAAEAGAELKAGEGFRSLARTAEGLRVRTDSGEYLAKIVIGADGYFSRVAPYARGAFSRRERRFCVIADAEMGEAEIDERMGDFVTLRYGYVRHGYAWAFPKRRHVSFGVGGALEAAPYMARRLREFAASFGVSGELRIRGCFIPVTRFGHSCAAERVLLVGDAAGFVDCFSGEGIRTAIASGRMAAETAIEACGEGDFSLPSMLRYRDRFYAAFKRDLQASNLVSDIAFRFPDLVLGSLLQSDEALMRYLDVTKGELSFADYAAWVARRMPLILARRLVTRRKPMPSSPGA